MKKVTVGQVYGFLLGALIGAACALLAWWTR